MATAPFWTWVKPVNLGKYLSSPAVSTVPTPDVGSTVNLANQIDTATGIVNTANAMGLVAPSVQKPGTAGMATAFVSASGVVSKSNPGASQFVWLAVAAVIGIVAIFSLRK